MDIDLVLDGGGVRGIGLVGAAAALGEAGYEFRRVAGTSAGAVVGSLVAAGMSPSDLKSTMRELDYGRFRDGRRADRVPFLGRALTLLVSKGFYAGAYLRTWLGGLLADLGVRTFGDLRIAADSNQTLPMRERYKLVVLATDVSRGRLVCLPWDYPLYGLDPDEQPVVDAIRASASIPFFFEPVQLRDASGETSMLVDGGVVSNFPVGIFDRDDGCPPRWPTFGVKLSTVSGPPPRRAIAGPVGLALAIVSTMVSYHEEGVLDRADWQGRTIFVETGEGGNRVDFSIDDATRDTLYLAGRRGAQDFLSAWDWNDYLARRPAKTTATVIHPDHEGTDTYEHANGLRPGPFRLPSRHATSPTRY